MTTNAEATLAEARAAVGAARASLERSREGRRRHRFAPVIATNAYAEQADADALAALAAVEDACSRLERVEHRAAVEHEYRAAAQLLTNTIAELEALNGRLRDLRLADEQARPTRVLAEAGNGVAFASALAALRSLAAGFAAEVGPAGPPSPEGSPQDIDVAVAQGSTDR